MSLLDDVSIVVTPNGYKAGRLYGVLPTATLGSELLSQPVDLQTDFTTNSGGVIVDADTFTTAGGTVDGIKKNSFLTVGTRYKLIIEGTTTSSGFTIGNISASGNEYGIGFGTHIFTATVNDVLWIRQSTAGTTNITSFSIKEWTASDMDVTRATAATRVDENGLVNYAEVLGDDLVTDGDFPTGTTSWSAFGGWNINGGKAEALNVNSGNLTQNINFTNTKTYKIQFDISDYVSGEVRVRFAGGSGFISSVYVSGDNTHTLYLQSIGNTELRFQGQNNFTASIDNVSVKEVTRNNVPRIDYTGGGCPHILAEPQRTNLVTYSEDFSQWSNFRSTLTPNETTSPDGTINAYLVEQDYPNTSVHGGLNKSIAVTNGVEYTYSFFVKKKEYSFIELAEGATSGSNVSTWFDVENGVVGNIGAGSTAQIENFSNGWYRCSITFTSAFTGGRNFVLYLTTANGSSVADIVGGAYIYGAQLEAGSYPTSYIPTSGSSVTRNQDIFTRDGIGSLINSTEGVLFAEISALANDSTNRTIGILGDSNNYVELAYRDGANEIRGLIVAGASVQANMKFTTSDTTLFNKVAVKWKVNDAALWINGVEVLTDTTINTPTGLSELNFYRFDATDNFFGKVKQLQVYDTALTDMQLIQLTGTAGTDFYESYSEMAESLTYTIQ